MSLRPARLWLAGVLVLTSLPAAAYERSVIEGTEFCLYWAERELPWTLGSAPQLIDPARAVEVARRSFQTWEDVGCSDLRFREEAPAEDAQVGFLPDGPNQNLIVSREVRCEGLVPATAPCWLEGGCAADFNCWEHEEALLARTVLSYVRETGRILDADIELNAAEHRFTALDGPTCGPGVVEPCVDRDLESVLTHEIGHMIGLDHSTVEEATLYATAGRGELHMRTLEADDEAGVCAIYPRGEEVVTCTTPFAVVEVDSGEGCSCSTGSDAATYLGAAALLLVARRRRT